MSEDLENLEIWESIIRKMDRIKQDNRTKHYNNYYNQVKKQLEKLYKVYLKYTCMNVSM